LKGEVVKAIIPKKFEVIENDLINTHNIRKLEYGDKVEIIL